jgi:hypothetical protein
MTMLWCRKCDKEYDADEYYLCPVHHTELEVRPAEPAEPVRAEPDDAVCWKCGHRATNATSETCAECHEPRTRPLLVIEFPGGSVVIRTADTPANLGREGEHRHVFAHYPNVSRWHATVNVDAQGDAWLTPNPAAPNGTFVNDDEIFGRTRVGPHDVIRFATDRGQHIGPTSVKVRQPQREP